MEYASVAQTNMNSITRRHIFVFAGTKFSTVTNSQSKISSRVTCENRHLECKSAKGVPAVDSLGKAPGFPPHIA
jgi:hypothetical protein